MKTAPALCAFALVIAASAPSRAAPEDPGPYAVDTQTFDVPVASSVSLGTDVYLPSGAGPAPLVVLRHGYLSSRHTLDGWGQHLGSQGFVTAIFDSRDRFTDDSTVDGADMVAVTKWLVARSADASSPMHGRIDPTRIALGGHSAGGGAATVAAAALPGIGALVLLDTEDTAPALAAAPSLSLPAVGIFGATSSCNENGDNKKTLASTTGPRLGVYVTGASHCDAEDPVDPLCEVTCGLSTAARHAEFSRYATAFLRAYFFCDASAYPYLGGAMAQSDTAVALLTSASSLPLPPPSCGVDAGGGATDTDGGGSSDSGSTSSPPAADGGSSSSPSGGAGEQGCTMHALGAAKGEGVLAPLFLLGVALLRRIRRRAGSHADLRA